MRGLSLPVLLLCALVCVTWDEIGSVMPWNDCPNCAVVRYPVEFVVGSHHKEFESIEAALEYFAAPGLGSNFRNFKVKEGSCAG